MIDRFIHRLRVKGTREMAKAIRERVFPTTCKSFKSLGDYVANNAIEIGDYSPIFNRGMFPIYQRIGYLDRVLKTAITPWTKLEQPYPCPIKHDYITCGVECAEVPRHHYDLVISSHVLEHICNPIKALANWETLLRSGGTIVLVLPNRLLTNDHSRAPTAFDHILEDYRNNVTEAEEAHIEDFCRNYDFRMFTGPRPTDDEIIEMASRNAETGIAHIHTWDMILTLKAVQYAGFIVTSCCHHPPFHIVIVATAP